MASGMLYVISYSIAGYFKQSQMPDGTIIHRKIFTNGS